MIWLLFACTGETPSATEPSSEPCESCGGECLDEAVPARSARHLETDIVYDSYPPTGGDHDPCWAEWGVYTEPLRTENWVHNLEHGGIVFLYDPTLPAEDISVLTTWVGALPQGRAILTPASEPMEAMVAAVSWEHRLLLGCFDGAALDDYFWEHVGLAPEDITSDPGACAMESDSG